MRKFAIAFITLLALIGLLTILYANSIAVGVGPDSAVYFASAQSMLKGDGLSVPTGIDQPIPMTHYAPLYPSALGLLGITGLDLNTIAKGLNAILFCSTVFLVGLIVLQNSQKSLFLAPLASLFILASEDMLTIHSYAWSEPLFISLCTLGLFLFAHYLWKPGNLKLIASIGLLSMAFLTRYAGASILPVVFLGVLLFQEDKFPRRLLRSLGLTIACAIPALLWFIRNFFISGNISDRNLTYHPLASHDIRNGLDTLSNWFLPGRISGTVRDVLVILFLAAAVILISIALFKNSRKAVEKGEWALEQIIPTIFALFGLSYLLLLVFTIFFMDAQSTFNYRLLSPLLISGTIVAFSLLPSYWKRIPWMLQLSVGVLFILVVVFNAIHSLKFVTKAHEGSFKMYAGSGWQEAEIIQEVMALPGESPIYSNGDDAITYVAGRPAARFPQKSSPFSLEENQNYIQDLDQMRETLRDRRGYIVCFTGMTWRGYLPNCEELEALFPLALLWAGDEGMIYTLESE